MLSLLNVFRLLLPMLLLVVFFFDSPGSSVGSVQPGLFIGVTVAYFAFGAGLHPDDPEPRVLRPNGRRCSS